jgi:metallo-beta-lactamase class B
MLPRILPALLVLAPVAGVQAQDLPAELVTGYTIAQCPSCAEWNAPHAPFRLHGNSYYVGTAGLASILITSPEGHVLIDGGLPDTAPLILANIRALGFDIADVKLILNSHPHYDHAGGIAALQHLSDAAVVMSAPSARVLATGKSEPGDPQYGIAYDIPAVPGVTALVDGTSLRVGPIEVTPHVTGGHTPGSTTWTWRSCDGEQCLDLVYADSQTPVSADGFRFTDSPRYPDAIADFRRGHARIGSMPCDILVTPHPGASRLWERLARGTLRDPAACRQYAERAARSLERRLAQEAAGG